MAGALISHKKTKQIKDKAKSKKEQKKRQVHNGQGNNSLHEGRRTLWCKSLCSGVVAKCLS
jgi:hypothetical protein